MFGWRRRRDGFEWREYVRTTILLRRKNRRDRVEQAAKAAVDGLKVAGERGAAAGAAGAHAVGRGAKAAGQQGMAAGLAGAHVVGRGAKAAGQYGVEAGASGAQALGRGARAAGRRGLAMSAAGARLAADRFRASLPRVLAFLRVCAGAVAAALIWLWQRAYGLLRLAVRVLVPALAACGRALDPVLFVLRQPHIALPLAIAGGMALLGAGVRVAFEGLDRDAGIALAIGLVVAGLLLTARLSHSKPDFLAVSAQWCVAWLRWLAGGAARLGALVPQRLGHGALRAVAAVVVMLAVACGGWLIWRALPTYSMLAGLLPQSQAVTGRAVAVSGDALRVAKVTVRMSGIEAPAYAQTCLSERGRRWRCGVVAKTALARLVRRRTVTCDLSGAPDEHGHAAGRCRLDEADIAAELVRGGHVFAKTGLFAAYRGQEDAARAAKAGIWRGKAERPSDYRAQKWEQAKSDAPDGCPIKGNVNRGRRIYVLPWAKGYERVRISRRRGERWFCSEEEARAAGWKPSGQS